ncbi:MAG: hypothetical protein AB1646_17640 [Thermodesulfobacteriota bacterium]
MTKRQIRANDIIKDIRAGKTDEELGERYGISPTALKMVMEKLVAAGAISEEEIRGRTSMNEDRQVWEALRSGSRNYIFFTIPIYDTDDLNVEGTVNDVSEQGLQIEGVNTTVGERRSFLIRADEFADVFPFVFDATCKWVETSGETGPPLAGFEIDNISEGGSKELRKLIGLLTL